MLLVERRNRKSVQIFILLSTFLFICGFFFWFFQFTTFQVPDYFPEEVHANQKIERKIAIEKVKKLQKGFGDVTIETYYDDPEKKGMADNGFENAAELFRRNNSSSFEKDQKGKKGGLTADSFYDEKLKQKQAEDHTSEKKQEDVDEDVTTEAIKKNETISQDLVRKSAAVQRWLAKKEGVHKPLSEFESSLKIDKENVQSKRRNAAREEPEKTEQEE